jgi:energy-coupling factor transporter ATP-binding protein EcfA2
MLYSVEFANSNSFRDVQDFNLSRPQREARRSEQRWPESTWNHAVSSVAAIFGANASGKSGLIRALWMALKNPILDNEILTAPFRLDRNATGHPITFDIRFQASDFTQPTRLSEYHYRFEATPTGIVLREELRFYPENAIKSQRVFRRETASHDPQDGSPGYEYRWGFKGEKAFAVRLTQSNGLFLRNTRFLEGNPLAPVLDWLENGVHFYSATGYERELTRAKERLHEDSDFREKVARYISQADLGIVDLEVISRSEKEIAAFRRSMENRGLPEGAVEPAVEDFALELRFIHASSGGTFTFVEDLESDGTRAMLAFASIAIDALEAGTVLVIDEIDTSLHPLLVRELIRQFTSPDANPRQAQLVFTTHDVTLLHNPTWLSPLLDRDQIWLIEKDGDGASTLYSVAEFPVRNDENVFRKYLAGQYGSVPHPEISFEGA